MLKKGSKLNSILTGSCPKCQNESMYLNKNRLHLTNILKMNKKFSHCDFKNLTFVFLWCNRFEI